MANIVFDAEKYALDDPLATLGWSGANVYNVKDVAATGRKCWQAFNAFNTFNVSTHFTTAQPLPLHQEILLVNNFTCAELGESHISLAGAVRHTTSNTAPAARFGLLVTSAGVVTAETSDISGALTFTTSTAPTGITQNSAIAMRLRVDTGGTKYYAKMWGAAVDGLEAAEPAGWNYIADYSGDVNADFTRFAISDQTHANVNRCSLISLGTEGDTALFSLPEQTVAVPTGLSATPTDTTASLAWT